MSTGGVADTVRLAALARVLPVAEANPAAFDRLAELAGIVLDAPVGLVSLIGSSEQHLVGLFGLGEPWGSSRRVPLGPGWCLATLRAGQPLFVENVEHEPDYADDPASAGHVELGLVAFAGVPLRDRDGCVLGVLGVTDTRPRRWRAAERRAMKALGAAVVSELMLHRDSDRRERLLDAFDAAPAAIAVTRGSSHELEYANRAFRRIFGDLALGLAMVPESKEHAAALPSEIVAQMREVWTSGETLRAKAVPVSMSSLGEIEPQERLFDISYSLIGEPRSGKSGAVHVGRSTLVVAVEVTDSVRARSELERYARHQGFLARAAAALNSELDPLVELTQLAQVVVPEMADLATVHLLARPVPPFMRPALPVITDRVAVAAIPQLGELPPLSKGLIWDGDGDPITETIRHGRLLRQPYVTPVPPSWSLSTGSAPTIRAGLRHIVLAPVIVDGLVVAVVSFGMCDDRPSWREDELSALAEVARVAGAALGHGISYQQVRDSALVLQRSLLGELPKVEGLEFCARYRPAGQDEVGGDWYDAFPLDPVGGVEGLALVVGDVVGHDIAAAAAMGQLRASLRSLALDHPASPADIVNRLARINAQLGITDFATLVHAQLSRLEEGCWVMRWALAGHLPPLLVTQDGTSLLDQATGSPLMAVSTSTRVGAQVVLPPGSTILLYTDGLVERRGADLADCLSALAQQATELADLPLERLCDEVLGRAPMEDDAAVLVVRVAHSRDRSPGSLASADELLRGHSEPGVLA